MNNKKEKLFLILFIASAIANVYLLSVWRFSARNVAREYYADGVKTGAYWGFEQGLIQGRNCITEGIVGECEGEINAIFEIP